MSKREVVPPAAPPQIDPRGAECDLCHRRMLEADGCIKTFFIVKGRKVFRLPYAGGWGGLGHLDDRCHDCNCKVGEYHHLGCDVERCPICGGQMLCDDCTANAKEYIAEAPK